MNNHVNKFSHQLNALYWSNDGDFSLSDPLKMYRGYLIEKIGQNHASQLNQLAWRIVHVVTGIFVYPVLGLLTGLDIGIKLLRWHLKKGNQDAENSIDLAFMNLHEAPAENFSISLRVNADGSLKMPQRYIFREYEVAFGSEEVKGQFDEMKKRLADDMKKTINQLSDLFTRVNVRYFGSWEDGMNLKFITTNSSLPYCSNPLLPIYEKVTVQPA